MDHVPDPLLLRKSGSAGNRTQDLWICSKELWPLDHRGGPMLLGVWFQAPDSYTQNTIHPKKKKQNDGDVPKKTSENKLKTKSVIMKSFHNSKSRGRTTYNAEQKHKNNIEF
jgi:hypothetical protein